jgi:hypothetical protein
MDYLKKEKLEPISEHLVNILGLYQDEKAGITIKKDFIDKVFELEYKEGNIDAIIDAHYDIMDCKKSKTKAKDNSVDVLDSFMFTIQKCKVRQICSSLWEDGFFEPCFVNEEGEIVYDYKKDSKVDVNAFNKRYDELRNG